MLQDTIIGVLGGMGPKATNYFCSLVTAMTPAECDQEHIPVLTFNNSGIPSRLEAILHGGESPMPELLKTARVLERAGASFLVIPCNTAHFYIEELRRHIGIPILDMVEYAVMNVRAQFPDVKRIGLLASSATVESGLYTQAFADDKVEVVAPTGEHQTMVMNAIFGPHGVKAGEVTSSREALYHVAEHLLENGCDAILAGCTEVSVAFENHDRPFTLIDPLRIMAQTSVSLVLSERNGKHSIHTRGR